MNQKSLINKAVHVLFNSLLKVLTLEIHYILSMGICSNSQQTPVVEEKGEQKMIKIGRMELTDGTVEKVIGRMQRKRGK